MSKKIFISCLSVLLLPIFVGCNKTETSKTESNLSNSSTSQISKKSESDTQLSTSTSSQITDSTNKNNKNNSSTSHSHVENYPYKTELEKVTTFNYHGANVPNSVTINPQEQTVTFTYKGYGENDKGEELKIAYTENTIPTKEIRIFSANNKGSKNINDSIRTVKVNTELALGHIIGDNAKGRNMGKSLYLFTNKNNSLSLATPNYAGNIPDESYMDVMLEVLE